MKMLFDDGISEDRPSGSTSSMSLLYLLKTALFHVHFQHFPTLQPSKHHSLLHSLTPLFLSILHTFQLLSVLLSYGEGIQDYTDSGLASVRRLLLGTWAFENGQETLILLLSAYLPSACIVSYALEVAFALARGEGGVPQFLVAISQISFWLLHRALLYPCIVIWMEFIFGDYENWQRIVSCAAVVLCWLLLSLRLLFIGDNNWFLRKSCQYAKSNCLFELREVGTAIALAASNRYFASFSPFYGCISAFLLLTQLTFFLTSRFPYLNPFTQACRTIQYVNISWLAMCMLLGLLCDTVRASIALWVFLSPCLALFVVDYQRKRLLKWRKCEDCESFRDYEIAIRLVLQEFELGKVNDFDLKNAILTGSRRFAEEKRAYLLFSQYYYYLRDEAEYALLRLACANRCTSSLIPDFQVYHFFLRVSELVDSEERNYLQYVGFYRQTMSADFKLCEGMCEVMGLLTKGDCGQSKLEAALSTLAKSIKHTELVYKQARSRFPGDSVLKSLHESLLKEVFLEKMDAVHGDNTGRQVSITDLAGYSAIDNGAFVISCSEARFGKIVFANQRCAEILETTVEEIEGRDLDDFLPPPFYINHNRLMVNFIQAGEAREIFRNHLFLYAHTKYAVEVTFRFRPTGYRGIPYFVVAIRSKPHVREFALYDGDMRVTSHSKEFPTVIGVQVGLKGTLNGQELKTLLPGIERKAEMGEGRALSYTHPTTNASYYMLFASTGLGSRTVRWVYIFHSEKNVRDFVKRDLHRSFTHAESINSTPSFLDKRNIDEAGEAVKGANSNSFALSKTGTKLRKKTNSAGKRMKIAFGVGSLAAASLAFISALFIFTLLNTLLEEHTDTSSHIFLAPLRMAEIVHFTRKLQLIDAGIEPAALTNLTNSLEISITELERIAGANYRSDTSRVVMWSQPNHSIKYQYLGLGSALSDFLMHANALLAEKPLSSADFFYIYRNGLGELMRKLHLRTGKNGDAEEEMSELVVINVVAVTFVGSIAGLGLTLLCVLQSHMRLRAVQRRLWKVLVHMNTASIERVVLPFQERLAKVHGLQTLPCLKAGKRRNYRGKRSLWQHLVLICAVYVASSTAIYLFTGVYGYKELQKLTTAKLDAVHVTSHMLPLPLLTVIYAKEFALSSTNSGYFPLIPEGQLQISLSAEAMSAVQELCREVKETMRLLESWEIRDIYLYDNCPLVPAVANCAHKVQVLGMETAILELRTSLSDLFERGNTGLDLSSLFALETQAEALTTVLQSVYSISMQLAEASIVTFQVNMIACYAAYCTGCLLLYLLLYFPYVRRRTRQCVSLWTVMLLIKTEFVIV